ncbi:MAG: PilN domain-containing protein [Acidiferrobacterales bacterium]
MNQQVNLYHPVFRRQEKKFSARAMMQAGAVVLVGISLLYAYSWWRVATMHAQARDIDQQQVAAVKRLADISSKFPPQTPDPVLAAEVQRLKQRIASSTRAYEILKHDTFGSTSGYSHYLIALARQQVPGLWLTGFSISGAGEIITLEGRSRLPDLVPRYLQKLSAETVLAGTNFQVFRLDRPERDSKKGSLQPYFEFVIKTSSTSGGTRNQS